MGDEIGGNEAKTTGSGQSVNVIISSGSVKWLVIAVLAAMGLLLFTNHTASKAELKSNQAVKASEDLATEYRIVQLWAARVVVSCQKGESAPALPAVLIH